MHEIKFFLLFAFSIDPSIWKFFSPLLQLFHSFLQPLKLKSLLKNQAPAFWFVDSKFFCLLVIWSSCFFLILTETVGHVLSSFSARLLFTSWVHMQMQKYIYACFSVDFRLCVEQHQHLLIAHQIVSLLLRIHQQQAPFSQAPSLPPFRLCISRSSISILVIILIFPHHVCVVRCSSVAPYSNPSLSPTIAWLYPPQAPYSVFYSKSIPPQISTLVNLANVVLKDSKVHLTVMREYVTWCPQWPWNFFPIILQRRSTRRKA